MPKTIRDKFDKELTYDNLMKAHKLSRKGKGYRDEVILFNLKQEEYVMWLFEELKNMTYKHRRIHNLLYIRAKGQKNRKE